MKPKGRPATLDPDRRAEICELITAGYTYAAVARLVGCNVKTIHRHAARNRQFRAQLKTAEVSATSDPMKMMRRAATGSWRAAAWLLERTEPDRYLRKAQGTCRAEDVQPAFDRLIEVALRHTRDEAARRDAWHDLSQAAEEESLYLFLPPQARPNTPKRQRTSLVDIQKTYDWLDAAVGGGALSRPRIQTAELQSNPSKSENPPAS